MFYGRNRAISTTKYRAMNFMSREQIELRAPSVFAETPHEKMSDRYLFISTATALETLLERGWGVVQAFQSRCREEGGKEYVKHMLRLQNERAPRLEIGALLPEIVIVNAHNGTSAFSLSAGLFRLVCLNGLMVPDSMIQRARILHKGYSANDVIDAEFSIIDSLPVISEHVKEMRETRLNPDERLLLAETAASIRWDTDDIPIEPHTLLNPRRNADTSPDLFTTFNVLQENIVEGGIRYRKDNGRRNTTRSIVAPQENARVNRALFDMAVRFAALKNGRAA